MDFCSSFTISTAPIESTPASIIPSSAPTAIPDACSTTLKMSSNRSSGAAVCGASASVAATSHAASSSARGERGSEMEMPPWAVRGLSQRKARRR